MLTKKAIIDSLNAVDNPSAFKMELRADDGQGNQLWAKNYGRSQLLLNRFEDDDVVEWTALKPGEWDSR